MTATTYYKATRPEGTDFRTGLCDYAAACGTGEIIRHRQCGESDMIPDRPGTYLSVSVEPADCTGMAWPCRLFKIEPVGKILDGLRASPNKRACSAFTVTEELPAHMALGPNGQAVAAVIRRTRRLTRDEMTRLAAARDSAWAAAGYAAGHAAGYAARYAAWQAAWYAAWEAAGEAAGEAARYAARYAARDAATATLVKDKITQKQYDLLMGPWLSVVGTAP